jgi:predicted heme/steroid binding protein
MKKGKEITEAWLARQLRPYEVSSKSMWIDGESAKGYEMSDLEDAFQRYIPKGQARRMLAETIGAAAPAAEKSEGPGAKAEGESEV